MAKKQIKLPVMQPEPGGLVSYSKPDSNGEPLDWQEYLIGLRDFHGITKDMIASSSGISANTVRGYYLGRSVSIESQMKLFWGLSMMVSRGQLDTATKKMKSATKGRKSK